ncbi:SNF2 helicase-associated domain-containing protein [Acidaminococcus fermentans]|uniref:SNF2 helicase-associated domain-containing protein n=1 Tax=Acidaminococcus fermentans TaxID=905 RepID=UPI00242D7544|nr:SNF2 helicase-associated domain-containing protein [Acidaminococcus fermentans]
MKPRTQTLDFFFTPDGFQLDSPEQEASLLDAVPFAPGSTWIDPGWLHHAWEQLNQVFAQDLENFSGTLEDYLKTRSGGLRPTDRIYFHLVENKRNETYPFAFLATYATCDAKGEARHMPLSYALQEYREDWDKLLQLLSSLEKEAQVSPFHGRFISSGEIFHPFGLTPPEAYEFLKTIPQIEDLDIRCRIPNWWRQGKQQIALSVKIGDQEKPLLGAETLLTLQSSLTVDGVSLTPHCQTAVRYRRTGPDQGQMDRSGPPASEGTAPAAEGFFRHRNCGGGTPAGTVRPRRGDFHPWPVADQAPGPAAPPRNRDRSGPSATKASGRPVPAGGPSLSSG